MWYFGTPPHAEAPIHSTAASRAAVEGRNPPLVGLDPYSVGPGYDYEPLLNSPSPTGTSDSEDATARGRPAGTSMQAFTNTYRAIVGTGILALPGAIEAAGIGTASHRLPLRLPQPPKPSQGRGAVLPSRSGSGFLRRPA